jgi:hypothetical protein
MSDFLFARPSILEAIGRNIDLFGILNTYNDSKNAQEADLQAMRNDIEALRKDFYAAYGIVINGDQIKKG